MNDCVATVRQLPQPLHRREKVKRGGTLCVCELEIGEFHARMINPTPEPARNQTDVFGCLVIQLVSEQGVVPAKGDQHTSWTVRGRREVGEKCREPGLPPP